MKFINKHFLLIYLFIFAMIGNSYSAEEIIAPELTTIDLEQQAIENVRNSKLNHELADQYLNKALNVIQIAVKKADTDSNEFLRLGLSLFSLQIDTERYKEAGITLQMLVQKFPENPIIQVYKTAYSNVFEFSDYRKSLSGLKESSWSRMPVFLNSFDIITKSFNLHINTRSNQISIPQKSTPVIIILGSPLNPDGSLNNPLIKSLTKGKLAYERFPNSKIIVTGGRAKSGVTESYKMKQWLVNNKIPKNQIIMEDQSYDLVWQTMNTFKILKGLNPKASDIIIITSASKIRNANAVFKQEAFDNNMLDLRLHNLATESKKYNIYDSLSYAEKVLIIKDTLRAAGIWMMPGMSF
ncbi:YdcF family protein [Francisella sp. Scap27]|uniref:YdcF family protein n=1 Tax=Francisella sp. Scap27 TaxID=2589986 RepID=UPI0015B95B48|nr:YdcF family protein [Francisella sp. Scap27]QLE78610.1 YdcF family protein [Francisella sp. Scap27]